MSTVEVDAAVAPAVGASDAIRSADVATTRVASATRRDLRIDAAKAVAIVLVVIGHARGTPAEFTLFASSFRVQLFFLVSGWLMQSHGSQRTLWQAGARLTRTLLVPFVVFFFVAYAYWLMTRQIGEKALRWGDTPWWDPLTGLATWIGPRLYVHPAIWFLPALFTTSLAYRVLRRAVDARTAALVTLVVAAAWIMTFPAMGVRLPFALDVLPVSLFFFACGAWASTSITLPGSKRASLALGLLLAAPWAWLAWRNGRVDINQLVFGASPWRFFAASLLGATSVLSLSRLLQSLRVVQWIGRNTLLILCTHILVFFVLSGLASFSGLYRDGSKPTLAWALLVSAIALVACVPMRWLLLRYAPWALGAQSRGRSVAT